MGVSIISQSFRNLIAFLNPFLFRLGEITVSQFDDPFSVANSTARLAFVARKFLTCFSLSLRQSCFCFPVLSFSVRISEASGGWCSCSTIRLTSGLVTLIEASYSEDEVSFKASHAHRETKEVALYFGVSVWPVTAGMRTSLIARSSGSNNSAI